MGHSEKHYVRIWAILCGLLVLSVLGPLVADAIREGNPTVALYLTLITAFGIAFVKAFLVAKHFMHLDVEKPIVWYFLITALAFMVLFFAGAAPDVTNHEGSNWTHESAKAEVARGLAAGSGHHGGGHDAHGGGHDAHGGGHDHPHGGDDAHDGGHDDAHGTEAGHAEEAGGHH